MEAGLFGGFLYCQRHADGGNRADDRGCPEEPAPVQLRHMDNTQNREASQKRRTECKDAKAPEVDHESKNAREPPALPMAEPGRVKRRVQQANEAPVQSS